MTTFKAIALMLGLLDRGFNIPHVKINKERGAFPYKAPRSMTPEEEEYYAKHKHLNGIYK